MTAKRDYRAMRLATGLGIRAVALATGINRGRLSIIERGVPPTDAERRAILQALAQPTKDEAST
jgi:hypothetical protein